jgi:hypothetical protein
MDGQNPFDGLQLDDHFIVHDQIYFVSAVRQQVFVRDRQINPTFEGQPAKMQLVAQALFVCGFEQSRAKLTVHLDRCPNNRSGSRVFPVFVFSVSL